MRPVLCTFALLALSGSLHAARVEEPAAVIVVARDDGVVAVLDKASPDKVFAEFRAFAEQAPVNVAVGDVTGDGTDDIVVGAGPGGGPHVRVFSLRGELLSAFEAYPGFSGGIFVAVGDVNGDAANGGAAEIITGAGGAVSGPHVKVFDALTSQVLLALDTGIGAEVGVHVAAGDVNGDGFVDIITAPGPGGGPHVRVFDARSGQAQSSFLAYDPGFTGGVRVAAGDINQDGTPDIIVGAGAGHAGGHVKVFDGATSSELASFFAFDPSFTGGVFVAAGSVIVTPGESSGAIATVRIFGPDGQVQWLMPFPSYKGGLRVATSAGAMGKAPTRPNIPGYKIDETW